MANCPNCGRSTVRTQDWACQWCGYPLVSGFFKQIPITYQEAKAERLGSWVAVETVVEFESPVAEAEVAEEEEETRGAVAEAEIAEEEEETGEAVAEAEVAEEEEETGEAVAEAEVAEEMEETSEAVAEAEVAEEEEGTGEAVAEAEAAEEMGETGEAVAEAEVAEEEEETREAVAEVEVPAEEEETSEAVAEAEVAEEEEETREAVAEVEAAEEETSEPEIVPITIEELNRICKADTEAAEARFANVVLQVIGVVARIPPMESIENPCLILTNSEKSVARNLLCVFDKQHEAAINQLSVGQMVTVQGKYDGCVINILLNDCVLVGQS